MKNPLQKRYLRELRGDLGKYLVIFLLLVLFIGEVSGYLVASESMAAAYDESFEKYNIEDGNFTSGKRLTSRQKEAIREAGAEVYDLFFTDRRRDDGDRIRFFAKRDKINLECLMEGNMPQGTGEIAIDRMYADNNGLKVGDSITIVNDSDIEEGIYTVSGLVALSDYSALFEDNNDMMFDAKEFTVAIVTKEAFAQFDQDILTWRYAWKYTEPATKDDEQDRADGFVKKLSGIISIEDFVPQYQNQAIVFTGDDISSDNAMMKLFLYIVIIIIAFVFAVTTSNTIAKEATEIGTLRATGYTRGELLRHYMFLPVAVTLVAALVGNILGYTFMKQLNADLYYGSYSLPTYVTRWSIQALLETTVSPIVIMLVINWFILHRKLKLSPLRFLRKDLRSSRRKGAVRLSRKIPFFSRFRLRIIFQNISNYLVLLLGIIFANILLLFGLMLPSVLNNYMESVDDNMFSNYQYILTLPAGTVNEDKKLESLMAMAMFQEAVGTENKDAEKFSVWELKTLPGSGLKEEEIMLYGVADNSRYVDIDTSGNKIYVSRAYAEKWKLQSGDTIRLKAPYDDDLYEFNIYGIYPYDGALCIFMGQDLLNEVFDLGKDTFTGYFSDTPITDIDEKYIGRTIDLTALTKVSRQLNISFGEMMTIVDIFAIVMFVIIIYLMSKVIIEKNANSISMTKILGYSNGEIARLYVLVTSILVVIFLLGTIPLTSVVITWAFKEMIRMEMAGWIPFILSPEVYVKMAVYGLVTYAVVAVFEYIKISRVPMSMALKDAE